MKEQIHRELISLQSELSRRDSAVNHIENAKKLVKNSTKNGQQLQVKYTEQLHEVKNLTAKYQELVDSTEKLIDKIEKVDFPSRLDKVDNAITAIKKGVQNTKADLESIGRDLKDEIKETKSNLTTKVEEIENLTDYFTYIKYGNFSI